ncbi:MAG: hypothetical protein DGJ47_001096 [Rickettsiaceae bacterium]
MQDKYNKLTEITKFFHNDLHLTPVVGVELEFYLSKNIQITDLSNFLQIPVKLEKGHNQFEIDFLPSTNLPLLSKGITQTRKDIIEFVHKNNGWVNFTPKPFQDDFGNSMHIHLNFLEDSNIEKYANILCQYAHSYIPYLLQNKQTNQRLDHKYMAPTHICWGGNNRSAMIRIPDALPKRLEHRLPSADTDPSSAIYLLLETIKQALKDATQVKDFNKIHGNAFDPQYNLRKINQLR